MLFFGINVIILYKYFVLFKIPAFSTKLKNILSDHRVTGDEVGKLP